MNWFTDPKTLLSYFVYVIGFLKDVLETSFVYYFLYWNYLILNSHSPSGQPQPPNKEKISPPSGYALETAIANGRRIKETQKFGKEILQLLLLLWLVVSIYFVFHLPSHQEFLFKERETRLVVPKFESQ